jgi:ABC-type multidrug transport system fused ATPase/permease subunit/CRP-like cAMP-binding protein
VRRATTHESDHRAEARVSDLLRWVWPYSAGRRGSLLVVTLLSLVLFIATALLPLQTGRLLDTAVSGAEANEVADTFIDEWLTLQSTTRLVASSTGADDLDAGDVAEGVRATTDAAVAGRAVIYLDALFPGDLAYDVSGDLGRTLRSAAEDSDAGWARIIEVLDSDGRLGRSEVEALASDGSMSVLDRNRAVSTVIAAVASDASALEQRDQWRRRHFISSLFVLGLLIALVAVLRIITLRMTLGITSAAALRMQQESYRRVHDTVVVEAGVLGRPSMVSRCTSYVDKVRSAINNFMGTGVPAIASLLSSFVLLVWIDPSLAVVALTVLVLFEFGRRTVTTHWSREIRTRLDDGTRLSELADDAISTIPPARAAGTETIQRRAFSRRATSTIGRDTRISLFGEGMRVGTFTLGQLGVLAAIALIGFVRSDTSVGSATAAVLYVVALSDALGAVPSVVISLQEAAPYMERLRLVFGHPLRREVEGEVHTEPDPSQPSLRIERGDHRPPDGSHGCRDVSLVVDRGEVCVVVARRRSDRDAVAVLASGRDLPHAGRVLSFGVDLATLTLDEVRARVAAIDSEPIVVGGSVIENLDMAGRRSEDDLTAALSRTGLAEWVSALPEGLHTRLGRGGHHVPRSIAVRLGIARVLLTDAPVVVIVDPTDGLDTESATDVWALLRKVFHDRAVIVSTPRLELLEPHDMIHVIGDGTMLESGNLSELRLRSRHWAGLWASHTGGTADTDLLREVPCLAHLSEAAHERLPRHLATESYGADEIVFETGELSDRLFLVVRGSISLWDGERRLATLHDGDHLGDLDPSLDASSDARRAYTARTNRPTILRSLHRNAIHGGAGGLLDAPHDQRALYRLLARAGALTSEEIAASLPDIDTEATLDALTAEGAVVRSTSDGFSRWQLAGSARRTQGSSSSVLDRLAGLDPIAPSRATDQ